MATKVTSSSNRSSRKPAKPTVVTTSKGRQNRSAVSNATVSSGRGGSSPKPNNRVTSASNRTSTGSARVTGTPRPALPPRGGTGGSRPPQSGPVRPSIGKVSGPATKTATSSGSTQFRDMQTGRVSTSNQPGWPPGTESWAAKPTRRPVRASIGNVSGPATSPSRPTAKIGGRFLRGIGTAGTGVGAALSAIAIPGQAYDAFNFNDPNTSAGRTRASLNKLTRPKSGQARPNQGRTNTDPYGVAPRGKRKPDARPERTGTQLAAEMEGRPIPASKPPTARPPTPRPSAPSSTPPARRPAPPQTAPRSTGGNGGSRPSARPTSSAPASSPKAPPAEAKPAPKAPEEPNLYNVPRTGVAKFRTDMNPLGKKIVGNTNFSKSVPSERAFDTNSDYSSSLSIPDKKKRKS